MSYKVLAVVKFNQDEALVLDKEPVIKYENHEKYLFGLDEYGVFANSYYYDTPSTHFQAFAGRKFKIPMTDGTFIDAYGQWWDGGSKAFSEALGVNLIHITHNTIDALKKCYVYFGALASEKEYKDLRATYQGKVYEYYEYEKLINPGRYGLEVPQCNSPSISEELVDDYKRLGVKPEEVAADIEWINSSIRKAFEQVKERVLRDYSAKKEVESKCNSKT